MKQESIFIEADELMTKLEDPNLRIYDAAILFFRSESDPETAYEKYRQGHIPGAAFFDHQDFSDPDNKYEYMVAAETDLFTNIGHIGISPESEVVFYASGMLPAATRAWWILRYAGHDRVRVLNGGLAAWLKAGGELEQTDRTYKPTVYQGRLRPGMFASKEEVQAAIGDGGVCTEYTLPTNMYNGVFIPGSSFLSAMDLMEGMDNFVLDGGMIARLKSESQRERIITYCGGGIAATINAIAHLIAGHENVSVYDGSLIEWMGEGLPLKKSGEA